MLTSSRRTIAALSLAAALGALSPAAMAADAIKIGVFQSSSALPYFIAEKRGYFAEAGLEVEPVIIATHPLTVQAFVTGDIDAASNLVTLEGANIEARRPGTLKFIAINGQNAEYITEQFVVTADYPATTLADLKGARLFSAPGPANLGAAKAVLAAVGLKEGTDYTIAEQGMGDHMGAIQGGNFDGGYTLEPLASNMIAQGFGKRLEAGVISTYLLGDPKAEAYAAGAAVSAKLLEERPEVAKRFAEAWAKAVKEANDDASAREYLSELRVPPALIETVPLAHFVMSGDLTDEEIEDFQKFIDIGVDLGVVKSEVKATDLLERF
ncbi:ABC transporter substrate-binding protein [Acuticoccus kandeliae]|uniref:ABC transporter substrate-binding protein n=1 Tax=Acuticoccus kandeliae TaxID=2073160 RepID=UPI000D3E2D0D|nr:ABC transporter substrate-binding protein [Acuticoccus kandeliae]